MRPYCKNLTACVKSLYYIPLAYWSIFEFEFDSQILPDLARYVQIIVYYPSPYGSNPGSCVTGCHFCTVSNQL
jgi:hypothetical protein